MKRIVVILTVAFITCFAGTSQAGGWERWGCGWGWGHRCWGPRPCVVIRPCIRPVWIPGYWVYEGPRRFWVRGYWR